LLLHACREEWLSPAPHKAITPGNGLTLQPTVIRLTRVRRFNLQPAVPIRQLSDAK
jgi:hypothetical protein